MLVYSPQHHRFIIDPHILAVRVINDLYRSEKEKEVEGIRPLGHAKVMWVYHTFSPHSNFRDYRKSTKSLEVMRAVWPEELITKKEKEFRTAVEKTRPATEEEAQKALKPSEIKNLSYDPELDPEFEPAIEWFKGHLRNTPLWASVDAYSEAMYNLSTIIASKNSSAAEIRTASQELDTLPLKKKKMQEQAEKDEAISLKVQGDKNVRRGERLPVDRHKQQAKAPS